MATENDDVFREISNLSEEEMNKWKDCVEERPPFSYIALIAMALQNNERKKETLSGIYKFISDNFAYYRKNQRAWQNSIRHNLSLNTCFIKLARTKCDPPGKGHFWSLAKNSEDIFSLYEKNEVKKTKFLPAEDDKVEENLQENRRKRRRNEHDEKTEISFSIDRILNFTTKTRKYTTAVYESKCDGKIDEIKNTRKLPRLSPKLNISCEACCKSENSKMLSMNFHSNDIWSTHIPPLAMQYHQYSRYSVPPFLTTFQPHYFNPSTVLSPFVIYQ